MSETEAFKEWLASAPYDSAYVECVIISHPAWEETLYLSNWDRDLQCRFETSEGVWESQTFQGARFVLNPPRTEDSVAQETTVSISAFDGILYDMFNGMSVDDRAEPMLVTAIEYIDTDLQNPTMRYPYPVWTIGSATMDFNTASIQLTVPQLRVRRIGRYFTSLELPILSYL